MRFCGACLGGEDLNSIERTGGISVVVEKAERVAFQVSRTARTNIRMDGFPGGERKEGYKEILKG